MTNRESVRRKDEKKKKEKAGRRVERRCAVRVVECIVRRTPQSSLALRNNVNWYGGLSNIYSIILLSYLTILLIIILYNYSTSYPAVIPITSHCTVAGPSPPGLPVRVSVLPLWLIRLDPVRLIHLPSSSRDTFSIHRSSIEQWSRYPHIPLYSLKTMLYIVQVTWPLPDCSYQYMLCTDYYLLIRSGVYTRNHVLARP